MVLFLKLDQKAWARLDYTDDASFDLSGTVYDDDRFATTRNISGFTPTLRIIDQYGDYVYENTTDITVSGSSGIFLIKFTQTNAPYLKGLYKVRLILEKSGSRITAVGVNGSDELFFESG